MTEYGGYVGLDVHKDTVAVAIAFLGREDPVYRGEIRNTGRSLKRLIGRLSPDGELLSFCYEAGPCGYGVYREIVAFGHACMVVAPSLIPRKPGDRVKTDRRDAVALARLHRSGDLTSVWVPGKEQEAIRDLTRAREDMISIQQKSRQRLSAFLLRHGRVFPGGCRWTKAHFLWLEKQKFELPVQQIVFQEYVDTVHEAQARVKGLEQQMHEALSSWSLRPTVEALISLRGVNVITAMTLLAELGDLTRFDSPRQLMSFLGLVPSEHSSGSRRRQGAITKAGNGHVRRLLVESAWGYRFPARKTKYMRQKAAKAPEPVRVLAWAAQKRLCSRYLHLYQVGKNKCYVTTAVARELVGFIWAVAREVNGLPQASRALG